MKNILRYLILTVVVSLGLHSCSAFLEIDPPIDKITVAEVFSDSTTIAIAANGLYTENFEENVAFYGELPFYISVISDECLHKGSRYDEEKTNKYNENSDFVLYFWESFYKSIYISNLFIEQLEASDKDLLTDNTRAKFDAEAKFFRAYSHLALTLLYGDIPYLTSPSIAITAKEKETPREEILENIVIDLVSAEKALEKYSVSNIYISVHAVRALLARVYTYQKEWDKAIEISTKVIDESGTELDLLGNVFLRSGKEAIFKISSTNSPTSRYIDHTRSGSDLLGSGYYYLTKQLLNDFEDNDMRYTEWVYMAEDDEDYEEGLFDFKSHKYKLDDQPEDPALAEEFVIFRLAEQYLIRAEARLNTRDFVGAHKDLNKIRDRAELPPLENLDQQMLTEALYQERRVELFFEEYHRWVDLARWGIIDQTLGAVELKEWQPHAALLPIPQDERDANVNLGQNEGYTQ